MALRSKEISDVLGTEIFDIDLAADLDEGQFAGICDLFRKHHLLVFPGQEVTAEQLGAFAKRFGELDPVVKREANDGSVRAAVHSVTNFNAQGIPTLNPVINANYFWHSDRAYRPTGSKLTMPHDEGRPILKELLEHSTQPAFVYAHRWRTGDLIVWDNRCLIHKATADYDMGKHRRALRRVVVQDTVVF